jgi:hypothetical protein
VNGTPGGGLFVCYWGQGVLHWDYRGNLHTYSQEQGITENNRFALEPEPGVIWVCARRALFESRNGSRFKKIFQIPSGFVYRAQKSPEGVWFLNTSEHGVYSRDGGQWVLRKDINQHLPSLNVRGITWLRDGELWLATMKGIVVFKGKEYQKTLKMEQGVQIPRAVNCIMERHSGEVWAGGFGGIGVRKDGSWQIKGVEAGIPGRTIYSLAEATDGTVWAGGSSGVGRFNKGKWKTYTIDTGLMGNECNLDGLYIDQQGDVWVGTMSALSRFDSQAEKVIRPPLRVFWDNGFSNGDTVRTVLPRGKRSLKISWIAPWLKPRRVEYRTRIQPEGQEAAWTFQQYETGDSIERLDHGTWDIQVQARLEETGDEGWLPPISANIEVPPYWWETLWFRIIAILLGAGVVAFLFILRSRIHKKRQLVLKKSIDQAVAEIKVLTGLIPICAWCKKIRDDKGYWNRLEDYIQQHSDADFSHGICPECSKKVYPRDKK